MGEFVAGRQHLEQALGFYNPDEHARHRYQYGQDIGASVLCYLCWALWHLGYAERAAEIAAQALKHADAVAHPYTLAYTICHVRGLLDIFRRLLLAAGRPSEEVEAALLQSLQIAHHQQARSWELRTACDLAQLWQHQGRSAKALRLLQATYKQFAEGFDSADLNRAKALEAELEASTKGRSLSESA
jgi:hypothetical protein